MTRHPRKGKAMHGKDAIQRSATMEALTQREG